MLQASVARLLVSCQRQWRKLRFGSGNDHTELTDVTLAVKPPPEPGSSLLPPESADYQMVLF